MKMKSVMSVLITLVISVVMFYGGIYYGVMKTDVYMENLMTEYEKISDEVDPVGILNELVSPFQTD